MPVNTTMCHTYLCKLLSKSGGVKVDPHVIHQFIDLQLSFKMFTLINAAKTFILMMFSSTLDIYCTCVHCVCLKTAYNMSMAQKHITDIGLHPVPDYRQV